MLEESQERTSLPNIQLPHLGLGNLHVAALSNTTAPSRQTQPRLEDASTPTIDKSTPSTPSTDVIGTVIGDFGIWQLRTILIVFLCKIPASWFMACIIFTAPELYASDEFICTEYGTISEDQCYVIEKLANSSEVNTRPCEHFSYYSDFVSLIMPFDLVCSRDILIAWTQFWHLFGVLLGGVAGTKMMLYISPRKVYGIGMVEQIVCGIVTGYAGDFNLHCIFRCLSAIGCAIMFTAGQTIFVDITSEIHRTGTLILYDTFWSIGVIFLPGLAWFFDSWTGIYLGITFPTLVLILLLLWTPDSPRWLLKNSKTSRDIDQVEQLLREAALINDRTFKIPSDFRAQLETLGHSLQNQPAPAAWHELWVGKRASIHMIATHIALAAFIVNYMGMLLNLRSFGRNYLAPNTIAMGFSEIVGCFLALHFALKHNKWKWQWAGSFNILAGLIGCLGWFFTDNDTMNATLKVTLWMIIAIIPKIAVSCAQSMILACVGELQPANKKAPFTFWLVTWARVWLLCAPFINVLKVFDTALSLSAYCWLSILGGISTCLILTPRQMSPVAVMDNQATKKEQSPLTTAVWTVEEDVYNTRL